MDNQTQKEKTMKRINYKSDFDFTLRLKDCEGNVVPFPDYDWMARFYTDDNKANAYVASCIGGECRNCFNDGGGQIHVVCDAHRLSAGKLKVEFHAQLPDEIYPDGRQLVVTPAPLDIELVRERYTADEESALHRKMINAIMSPDTISADGSANKALEEYQAYNAYVQGCKERVRKELDMEN